MKNHAPQQVCCNCGVTVRGKHQYERDHLCCRCRKAKTCIGCGMIGRSNICRACRRMLRRNDRLITNGCHAPQPGQEERIARHQERAQHQLPLSE